MEQILLAEQLANTQLAPHELPMAKMFMKRGPLSKKNQVLAVPGGLLSDWIAMSIF